MFTGIIEEMGIIRLLQHSREGAAVTVAAERIHSTLKRGDSVAVNGVCLTVTQVAEKTFCCDLSAETLRCTSFRGVREGMPVNLERPLVVGDRLGGHFVLGHVDAVGSLASATPSGDGWVMAFRFPQALERYLVYKGSIAVDGISLTIASLGEECFTVAIIPHTFTVTNLGQLKPGDPVNLEVDILGKYFDRFFQLGLGRDTEPPFAFESLKEPGRS